MKSEFAVKKPTKQAGKDHEVKHGHRGYAFKGFSPYPI